MDIKNKFLKTLSLIAILGTVALTSCGGGNNNNNPNNPGGNGGNGGNGGEVVPPGPDKPNPGDVSAYYKGLDLNGKGTALLSQIRDFTVAPHTHYTTYDDCGKGGKLKLTDKDPNDSNKVTLFYCQKPWSNRWDAGNDRNWNREHVWPKSLSSGLWPKEKCKDSYRGGGSDLHHIRPTHNYINTKRSSYKFGENGKKGPVTDKYTGVLGGYLSNSVFEPLDEIKGDVARIVLYTFVHYNTVSNLANNDNLSGSLTSTSKSSVQEGNLPINNVMTGSDKTKTFNLLRKWNNQDPVSEAEKYRNDVIQGIQGNRNPFIDHPWIVDAIWG